MASAATEARGFVRPSGDGVVVRLRVSPGARRTLLKGLYGEGAIKLAVAAPPVDGKANEEVECFLAGLLGVPPSDVSGASSRDKSVFVWGRDLGEVVGRVGPLL